MSEHEEIRISSTPTASPSTQLGCTPGELSSLAALDVELPEWHEQALCYHMDPTIFFGEEDGTGRKPNRPSLTSIEIRHAKSICDDCPVARECLEYAVAHDQDYGVWGGMTAKERKMMLEMYEQLTA